jgi:hypothetical protein
VLKVLKGMRYLKETRNTCVRKKITGITYVMDKTKAGTAPYRS